MERIETLGWQIQAIADSNSACAKWRFKNFWTRKNWSRGGLCQLRQFFHERSHRVRHRCVSDVYCMDRVAGDHRDVVLIFIWASTQVVDLGNVEEIRRGQKTIQSLRHAPGHAAQVEIHG